MEHENTKKEPNAPEQAGKRREKQPLDLKWKLIYGGIAAVFVVGLVMVLRQEVLLPNPDFVAPTPQPAGETPVQTPVQTPVATPVTGAEETPLPTPAVTPRMEVPTVIYFEAHKQQATIIAVGIDEAMGMTSPDTADEAGWFYYGAAPGNPGNAIVNGHQKFGGKKGVFSVLKTSKPGERVIVEFESGMLRFFEVERVEEYHKDEVPREYMTTGPDTPTRLVLITCLGDYGLDGLSKSRVVAICRELTELRQADDPVVDSYDGMA